MVVAVLVGVEARRGGSSLKQSSKSDIRLFAGFPRQGFKFKRQKLYALHWRHITQSRLRLGGPLVIAVAVDQVQYFHICRWPGSIRKRCDTDCAKITAQSTLRMPLIAAVGLRACSAARLQQLQKAHVHSCPGAVVLTDLWVLRAWGLAIRLGRWSRAWKLKLADEFLKSSCRSPHLGQSTPIPAGL